MTPMGRPEIGQPINVCVAGELLVQVDGYAQAESVSRAEAIRHSVQRGLRQKGK
jgi:hypothetical protein